MITNENSSKKPSSLIVRENHPVNLESPFELLEGLITPNHLFYVRNHFPVPQIDVRNYELAVSGAVQHPCTLNYEQLRAMPSETRVATLECAGNGRVFLEPAAKGVQWQSGAVGTAEWTGVPLSALLHRACPHDEACEVVFEGMDKGVPKEEPIPPGETTYARSIPLSKVQDVLIVYAMNGEDLSPQHGFPLRAIVPGHYGMASVKWLSSIRVTTAAFQGYFQTTDYAYWADNAGGDPQRIPLSEMSLKSQIARPQIDELIPPNSQYCVCGAAWSAGQVEAVEFSADDGETWHAAQLLDPAQPGVWQRWQFEWHVPATPGVCTLRSRARDLAGNLQPGQHDQRYGSYVIHHVLPVRVIICP